jgi:hypothetical protein
MAIGWLSVLKMVPWGDVIENAPKVATGAKKLWDKVGKKPAVGTGVLQPGSAATPGLTLTQLQAQVAELQLVTADLHQQMLDCTGLIKSLAEQNTQLIRRVEVNRRRVLWLAAGVLGLAVVLVIKLF